MKTLFEYPYFRQTCKIIDSITRRQRTGAVGGGRNLSKND
jgi:hypothetical protein